MERGARHWTLELFALYDGAKKRVRRQQDIVVKEDVIDPNDALLAKHDVRLLRVPAVHRQAETEVRVVIQIRTRRDDPVDKPTCHERNDCRHS